MPATMPEAVANYFAAKSKHDSDALVTTLTDDAVITDENHEYTGHDVIRAWNDRASTAFAATYEIADSAMVAGRPVAAVSVAGNFPGSPVTLLFNFTMRDGKIAALTIV